VELMGSCVLALYQEWRSDMRVILGVAFSYFMKGSYVVHRAYIYLVPLPYVGGRIHIDA
jgi:hypothetical protein